MKVALACPYAWDAAGGVQVHVRQLAGHLQARGHDVLVLAPAMSGPASSSAGPAEVDFPGDHAVRIVGRAVRIPYQGTVAPISPSLPMLARVGRALRGFGPDVVHAHEPLTPSVSMAAAFRSPAPVVATFHAFAERSALLSAAAPVLRPLWNRLRVRIAVSEAAARFVEARFSGEVRVIPNGCDVELFASGRPDPGLPSGRRMVWVGRLDPQKGFRVAVEAFGMLAPRHEDLRLVVAGDGRDRAALDHLAPRVRARVLALGQVAHHDLPAVLAGADVFVAPAVGQESFGLVLVEAMAAGVPVVASDIEGYREVCRPGIDGLLVRPGDPARLAAAVERVLTEPGMASLLAEAGRRRAGRYRWDAVATEVESAYADALAIPSRSRRTPR
jgi:phosphatidylinositol alpha-mannosyltransferase